MGLFHCIVKYYTSPEKHLKLIEFLSTECTLLVMVVMMMMVMVVVYLYDTAARRSWSDCYIKVKRNGKLNRKIFATMKAILSLQQYSFTVSNLVTWWAHDVTVPVPPAHPHPAPPVLLHEPGLQRLEVLPQSPGVHLRLPCHHLHHLTNIKSMNFHVFIKGMSAHLFPGSGCS